MNMVSAEPCKFFRWRICIMGVRGGPLVSLLTTKQDLFCIDILILEIHYPSVKMIAQISISTVYRLQPNL